jgi:hypothetical protein
MPETGIESFVPVDTETDEQEEPEQGRIVFVGDS